MLFHIAKDNVRKGMFIETVECPSHEFAKRRFLLDNDLDLQAIASSSAKLVLINTALGLDEEGRPPAAINPMRSSSKAASLRSRQVKQDIDHATTALKSNLEAIVGGSAPDLDALTPIVQSMASTWNRNPTMALEMTRLKSKDEGTYTHSIAVGAMMSALGRVLDMDEETTTLFGVAGILHDIGKLLIPNEILTKEGKLTDEERKIIKQHPDKGYELLKAYPEISPTILEICRLHHEVLDGSGYPLGLKDEQLGVHIRISTVCDVFEALTSARPYKRPWPQNDALKWMFARPQLFDQKLVVRLGGVLD